MNINIDKIVKEWRNIMPQKKFADSTPFIKAQKGYIPIEPVTHGHGERKGELLDNYRKAIREELYKKKYRILPEGMSCCLYVTFKKSGAGDVDNLLKAFVDAVKVMHIYEQMKDGKAERVMKKYRFLFEERGQEISHNIMKLISEKKDATPAQGKKLTQQIRNIIKEGIGRGFLLQEDDRVVGVKTNVVAPEKDGKQGIHFALIPTYKVALYDVKTVEGDEVKKLNELRKEYIGNDQLDIRPWNNPMQIVETPLGTFLDNKEGSLWGVSGYGKRLIHKPEPGFGWRAKYAKGEEVDGAMIYERSGCWWINKWAEE